MGKTCSAEDQMLKVQLHAERAGKTRLVTQWLMIFYSLEAHPDYTQTVLDLISNLQANEGLSPDDHAAPEPTASSDDPPLPPPAEVPQFTHAKVQKPRLKRPSVPKSKDDAAGMDHKSKRDAGPIVWTPAPKKALFGPLATSFSKAACG